MKIVNARIDERLIHGQVAMVWTNMVKADRIVVVNDAVLKDDMQIAAMKLAKPSGVKLSLFSMARAIERLQDGSYGDENIFLITKSVSDMVTLVNALGLKAINVGNVAKRPDTQVIKKSVYLKKEEMEMLSQLEAKGVAVRAQMLPTDPEGSIVSLFRNEG